MKTPKRIPTDPRCRAEHAPNCTSKEHARWKRKNRVKQLKRTINKYRDGTNLTFYSHELHAYKRLQELKKPGKKATSDDWGVYIRSLKTIHCHLEQAIHQAEREQEQWN